MQSTNLRVEITGFGINDYRANDGDLEFRALTPEGQLFSDVRSTWRRLTPDDLALHFRLDTVVGRWFADKVNQQEATATELCDESLQP